jgi:hypothetical protein
MSFNFGIRRPIAKSRVSSGSGGREGETFVDDYFEDAINESYQKMVDNPNLNAGQQAILEESRDSIYSFLSEVGEDYDPDAFLDWLEIEIGPQKYNALSETFGAFAEEDLSDAWDHATGGDGYGAKKFMGRIYN